MIAFFRDLFDTSGFPPRWHCGQWSGAHGWLHILSDIAIFGAYFAIPLVLVYFIRRRKDVPFLPIFWLFGAFILSCGFTHLIEATIFWHPWYRLSGLMKAVTAVVSWITVIALIKVIPSAVALPGLEKINRQLNEEITERQQAEEALRRSEERLKLATEAGRVGIWDWDLVNDTLVWDDAMFALYGARREDFSGAYDAWAARLHPEDRAASEAAAQDAIAGRKDYPIEYRVIWPDGSMHHLEAHGRVFRDEACRPVRMVGTNVDITARKLRERNLVFLADMQKVFAPLTSSVEFKRAASERLAEHLGLIHCTLLEVDEAADTCTVLHDHHAPGTRNLPGDYRLSDFHPEEERRVLASGAPLVIANVRADGRTAARAEHFEALGIRALVNAGYVTHGRWKFVLHASRAEPYAWPADEVELLTELAERIYVRVERARAEEALREKTHFLDRITAVTPDVLYVLDITDFHFKWVSQQAANRLGYSAEEVRAMGADFMPRVMHPDDLARMPAHFAELAGAADGQTLEIEYRLRHPDGSWRWFGGRKTPFTRDADGRVREIIGTSVDITARKRAEDALRENAAVFSTLITQAPMGTYVVDAQFRMRQVNAEAMQAFVSVQPLIGRDFQEAIEILWGPEVGGQIAGIFRHTLATGERYISPPFTEQRHDLGIEQTYEWETQRVTLPDGQHGVVCYFHEVTERARATEALRASQERTRLAAEATGVGIWEWNVLTNAIRWDAMMFRIYGIEPTPDGFVHYRDWSGAVLPEDLAENEAILQDTVRRGGQSTREFRIRRRSDGECRWVQAVETVRANHEGKAEWVLGTNLDVTERKEAEQVIRGEAQRKDEFLAMLGHELRNPLNAIRHAVQISAETPDDRESCQWAANVIDRQSQQLSRMVEDLLDVARINRGHIELRVESLDLGPVLEHAIFAARPLLAQRHHTFTSDIGSQLRITGDAARLEQVFVNLLTNAAKYTPENGIISLRAQNEDGEVVVAITDNGVGISAELLPHVFDLSARPKAPSIARRAASASA